MTVRQANPGMRNIRNATKHPLGERSRLRRTSATTSFIPSVLKRNDDSWIGSRKESLELLIDTHFAAVQDVDSRDGYGRVDNRSGLTEEYFGNISATAVK